MPANSLYLKENQKITESLNLAAVFKYVLCKICCCSRSKKVFTLSKSNEWHSISIFVTGNDSNVPISVCWKQGNTFSASSPAAQEKVSKAGRVSI